MAIVLRGKQKGKKVEIHQWCNDWVMCSNGKVYSPSALQYTEKEFLEIINHDNNGIMANLYKADYENFRFFKRKRI